MKTKILTLLTIFALLVPTAMAYDTDNPANFTVNFVTEASTTDFSVLTNTVQLNFSSFSGAGTVSPEGGNPWGNITNDANQPLNFSVKLDSLPLGITLKMGSSTVWLIDVGTSPAYPSGWTNVQYTDGSDKVDIVAEAYYAASTQGTETKQITIASAKP